VTNVTGDALNLATQKMLRVHQGKEGTDDRDSIIFKDLRSAGDFVHDKLQASVVGARTKVSRKLGSATNIRDIVNFDMFNEPIRQSFHKNSAARTATQINPLEMVSSSMQTTLTGTGGIQSDRAITNEAKFIDPSHLGYLDPINTPEGCAPADTEVFTSRGWVFWPEVRKEDLFACLIDGRMEFHPADRLVALPFSGSLHGLDTTRTTKRPNKPLKYLVTPGHRVWSRPVDGSGYRIDLASEMHGNTRVFQVGHAPYLGADDSFFFLPSVPEGFNRKNFGPVDIVDWAEFMGWFLSEGNVSITGSNHTGYNHYRVSLFQSDLEGTDGCARIERLLARLPFTWHRAERENDRVRYDITYMQLTLYLLQFGLSYEKFIPECAFDWPLEARDRLLHTLLMGDGRRTQNRGSHIWYNEVYTTTSRRLALDVERLIVSLGRAAKISSYEDKRAERYRDVYEVRIFQCPERSVQKRNLKAYFKQKYEGMVYCAEVPGGLLYMRRDGGIGHWTGNSKTGVSLRLPMGVKKVGNTPMMRLYNMQTHEMEDVPPARFMRSNVVLPDQIKWEGGKPVANGDTVAMAGPNNEIIKRKMEEAQYAMKHPSQMFNMTSNLIPFMHSTQGNRAGMASRHMEQSISLLHREPPLVQVGTGVDHPTADTFEKVVGYQASHTTPIAGKVKSIKSDGITIEGHDGKTHEVQLYHNYPLNDAKSVLHSEPLPWLKVGSSVKAGQIVADTNFSKNGTLALGTNLQVAYVPFKGYNFEDGVVISESAAKKLSSVHMYKPSLPSKGIVFDKQKYLIQQQGSFKKDQLDHIEADGLPKVGARIKPGDPLMLALKPFDAKDRMGITAIRKSLSGMHVDKSMTWDGETEGEVVNVVKGKDAVTIHVRAVEPMQVGDKLAGRFGNKGIVTMVLPDSQMPHTKKGQHMEVLLNPSGVPGRLNPGQILEVAASKIAEKTGKTFVVNNFDGKDWNTHIQEELKRHNLSDTDELIDPSTGKSIGQVTTGKQHILKLVHQVDKKVHVTPGMGLVGTQSHDAYDLNLQPHNGQRVGALGMYALLAHGAKANIREMQTWKSEGEDPQELDSKKWKSQHVDVWKAIQTGDPLPTPKATFAFKKFEEMLRGTGVNLEKKGHDLILTPMTHQDIVALAPKALKNPGDRLEAKIDKKTGELKTSKGGLFDEELTGGHGGRKWSRIDLSEPMPNPIFEAPIKALTGIKQNDFDDLVSGRKALNTQGQVVPMKPGLLTGGHAIEHLLRKIDVKRDLAKAKEELNKVPMSQVDSKLKQVKYLQALQNLDMKPHDAYILRAVPVIPPAMRPASPLPDGAIKYADLNHLYMHFGLNAQKLGDPKWVNSVPHEEVARQREAVYDGIKAIMGSGVPYKDQKHKGLLHQIAGPNPKKGFFQNVLMNKRQDLTMRSTIVPEPSLGLDQVGLPTEHALNLFRPFVVKKLQDMGVSKTPLQAQLELSKKSKSAIQALDKVMVERPVLLKRDPVLHKYGIQGFQPTRVEGNAIKIHPLVCGGYNADFDGDTMSVFVPISREAVAEAHKMKPTNNLFAESSGKAVYLPSHEMILGNYKLSMIGKTTSNVYQNPGQVLDAAAKGKIGHTDVVTMDGKKTTAGRILISTTLPQSLQASVLHDLDKKMDAKGLADVLTRVGKEHKESYDLTVNKLKDLGNNASYGLVTVPLSTVGVNNITDPRKNMTITIGAHTLKNSDFTPDREVRDRLMGHADVKALTIANNSKLSQTERDAQTVGVYLDMDKKMKSEHHATADETKNNLLLMSNSGIKPGWAQYKQLRMAPLMYQDTSGKVIPHIVKKTFSEGIDLADYWTHMHGARRGVVMRTQETRDPGYMSKLITNTMMDTLITDHDCGTNRGIAMSIDEKDIHDRLLAHDFKAGQVHIKAGTTLTPDIIGQVRSVDKDAKLVVRSPLKCEHGKGICQKCAGLAAGGDFHPVGTNIGVIATQTLGERATQLPMKEFHTGGVSGGGNALVNSFTRLEQLMTLPKKVPNSATLAMSSGTISKIEHTQLGTDMWINGKRHHVGMDNSGNPLHETMPGVSPVDIGWRQPRVGMKIDAGDHLSDPSRTIINVHDYYNATKSMDKVQNQLTNDIYGLYKDEGIRRRHVETIVKAMSGHTQVLDPGDSDDGIIRGEFHPLSQIQKINAGLVRSGKRAIEHKPALKGVNMLPLIVQNDWMAKLQHERLPASIQQAVATGQSSSIHSMHPVPAAAYGAEFGLNEDKASIPGMGHLKGVKNFHY
jgi:DNA-directed RNA polymerase subunit beta'